jgi:hypothetical protein
MPGLTKQAKKAYEKAKTIKALTKKNNIADLKKKKKNLGIWGIGKNIIDHGPEYA